MHRSSFKCFGNVPPSVVAAKSYRVIAKARKGKGSKAAELSTMATLPALIAFDLDGTLWYPEMYLLDGSPTKASGHNTVLTRGRDEVGLMGDSHAILKELATEGSWQNTHVAYVSRTTEEDWARKCLKLLQSKPGLTLDKQTPLQEIYPGNKRSHFQRLHDQTSIPYSQMLFFDNENRNCIDVAKLGVTCVYTPRGMTYKEWNKGLKAYAGSQGTRG